MTKPPEPVQVRCPKCQHEYEAWYRPSINTHIEPWTDEEIDAATSAVCPQCGTKVHFNTLVVSKDGTWEFRDGVDDDEDDEEE